MISVGDRLYGYCHGYFGDSYDDKIVIAVGRDFILVREVEPLGDCTGVRLCTDRGDVHELLADCLEPKDD